MMSPDTDHFLVHYGTSLTLKFPSVQMWTGTPRAQGLRRQNAHAVPTMVTGPSHWDVTPAMLKAALGRADSGPGKGCAQPLSHRAASLSHKQPSN